MISVEQPDCRDNESADGNNAPCEIAAERSDFGAEHARRDTLAVLGGLPDGIHDGVGMFGRELAGGQCASDGDQRQLFLPVAEDVIGRFVDPPRVV